MNEYSTLINHFYKIKAINIIIITFINLNKLMNKIIYIESVSHCS